MTTQKGAAPLLIALIIALLLGGGGFAVMKKQELIQKHDEEESLQLLLEQAKKSPKLQDKTVAGSDWKVYTSEKYGFEFKYPSDLFVHAGNNWVFLTQTLKVPVLGETCVADYVSIIATSPFGNEGYSKKVVDQLVDEVEKTYVAEGGAKTKDDTKGDLRKIYFDKSAYGPRAIVFKGLTQYNISYHSCGGRPMPLKAVADTFTFESASSSVSNF